VRLLGAGWDRLSAVPDGEIAAIQRVLHTPVSTLPHPYLRASQRVRITREPLTDLGGILPQSMSGKGLLVLSVELL
jgi:hypothetical protein